MKMDGLLVKWSTSIKKFSEYMVPFIDGSKDYICITETDDLEIILL